MKKYILSLLFLLYTYALTYSQLEVQLSQYMLNNTAFNPAFVGEGDLIQMTGQQRVLWVGVPDAGQTTIFGINAPLKFDNNSFGIGLNFLNDKSGLFSQQNAQLQFAYKKKINTALLSVGLNVGFASVGFLGSKVNIKDLKDNLGNTLGTYHSLDDPLIPNADVNGMSLDLGLGLLYTTPLYYAGLSYLHFNKPHIVWEKSELTIPGCLYLTGGYNYNLSDPKYVLKPSALLKSDFSTLQLDLSSRLEYDNKYWGGLSYRYQDALVFLAGINLAGGLSIGYSYDFPISQMIKVSSGSHEVLLNYSFEYVSGKRTTKYKSIRIL